MKKFLLMLAVLLPSFLAHSQEANQLGSYAELNAIARLDLTPSFSAGNSSFSLGNSSVFTHFTGAFSEHISWTMINQWYEVDVPFLDGFRNLGRSDTSSWLDYLYVNFHFGNWELVLGKQMIATGGMEFQQWDWDSYSGFTTPYWDGLVCSHWGAAVSWQTPSKLSKFTLQMLASPYGERPFGSGLWVYSAQWMGEYDWYSPIWSVSSFVKEDKSSDVVFCIGQNIEFDENLNLELDYFRNGGFNAIDRLFEGHTLRAKLNYAPIEKFDFALNGIYVNNPLFDYWNAGILANYYPIDQLRIHAQASYESFSESFCIGIGATFNYNIKIK